MTKKIKAPLFTKQSPVPSKKLIVTTSPFKEVQLLGYLLCFILLHNFTLHNGNLHSVHKEALIITAFVLSYRPLLNLVKQIPQVRGFLSEVLKSAIHCVFLAGVLCVFPGIIQLLIPPNGLSLFPGIAAILIFSSKPSNSISVGPNKAASPDEIRKYVESLIGNLKSRLQYLGINILCFGYMTCYMASTFQQSSTVVKQMNCIKAQQLTAILHIAVLLVVQVLPIDYMVKLTSAANMLGRWQSAVLSDDQTDSVPEWKESVEWGEGSIVKFEDRTYLAISPTVAAHPCFYPHTLLHVFFCESFRVLKILALVEGLLVCVLFYQLLTLKFFQQFLPTSILLFLHLCSIMALASDAKQLNARAKAVQ